MTGSSEQYMSTALDVMQCEQISLLAQQLGLSIFSKTMRLNCHYGNILYAVCSTGCVNVRHTEATNIGTRDTNT
jgi:hypothetical protein